MQREASSRPGAEKKGNGEKKERKGRENERMAYLLYSSVCPLSMKVLRVWSTFEYCGLREFEIVLDDSLTLE